MGAGAEKNNRTRELAMSQILLMFIFNCLEQHSFDSIPMVGLNEGPIVNH